MRLPLHHTSLTNFMTIYSIFIREKRVLGLNPFRFKRGLSSCSLHPKEALGYCGQCHIKRMGVKGFWKNYELHLSDYRPLPRTRPFLSLVWTEAPKCWKEGVFKLFLLAASNKISLLNARWVTVHHALLFLMHLFYKFQSTSEI